MRKLILTISFLFLSLFLFAQTTITSSMNWSQIRSILNTQFDTLYAGKFTSNLTVRKATPRLYLSTAYYLGINGSLLQWNGVTIANSVTASPYTTQYGYQAGNATATGVGNTFIGYQAGLSNTSGKQNTFIGYQAGYSNVAHDLTTNNGSYNTFVGWRAGYSNLGSGSNTLIGCMSGYNFSYQNLLGYAEENVVVGDGAAWASNMGNQNVILGHRAFCNNYVAYSDNDTSRANIIIGRMAGMYAHNLNYNVIIGDDAGWYTKADNNVFIGRRAGIYDTTGTDNVFVGCYAGYTNDKGNNNTYIGSGAGQNGKNTSANNTFLGKQAGYSNSTGAGNLFLGYQAGYSETGSNLLYISNSNTANPLIKGDFSTGIVTINTVLKLTPQADPPGTPAEGQIYADTDHHLYYYNGTDWKILDN